MGLGWFLMDYHRHRVMNHNGSDRGFRSALFISPERKTVLVVLANYSNANVEEFFFFLPQPPCREQVGEPVRSPYSETLSHESRSLTE